MAKSMTFLEKYELVKKSVPVPALSVRSSIDWEYADFVDRNKNCYYCFNTLHLSDSMYPPRGIGNKVVYCYQMSEGEKCYQFVDCNKCTKCTYLIQSNNSTDYNSSAYLNA